MNKNIKKTVYKILEKDKLAREDDWYLIQQTLIQMLDCNQGTAFGQVLNGMKVQGISFEAITRQRRKFLEENPQYRVQSVEKIRRAEEENYYLEHSRHIPRID
nr:MAG TPA: hypothetical protein [Caudoviricetes sp.]